MLRLTDEQCVALYVASLQDPDAVEAMLADALARAGEIAARVQGQVLAMSDPERALLAHFLAASVAVDLEGADAGDASQ